MPNLNVDEKKLHPALINWETISDAFAFLATILNTPPNEEMIVQLRNTYQVEGLPIQEEADPYHLIAGYLHDSEHKSTATMVQELSVEWTRLFRGVSPTYGPQPPFAGVYNSVDGVGVNTVMEITQMYAAYGLGSQKERHNRLDYLGTQLDFISILTKKAAEEANVGNGTAEEAIRTDILDFLQRHLLTWVDTFIDQAREDTNTDFFKGYLVILSESLHDLKNVIGN